MKLRRGIEAGAQPADEFDILCYSLNVKWSSQVPLSNVFCRWWCYLRCCGASKRWGAVGRSRSLEGRPFNVRPELTSCLALYFLIFHDVNKFCHMPTATD